MSSNNTYNFNDRMGSCTMHALVALENPREDTPAGGRSTKALVFDGQCWVNDDLQIGLLLRYFNGSGMLFEDVGTYFVCASVTKMDAHAATRSNRAWTDYQLVGDIIWLFPVIDVDMRREPWFIATGMCSVVHEPKKSFSTLTNQWTNAFRVARCIPLQWNVPDTVRFRDKKVVPEENGYCQVQGFLKRVEGLDTANPDSSAIKSFVLDVDSVQFLGKLSSTVVPPLPDSMKTNSHGWKYDFGSSRSNPTTPAKHPAVEDLPEGSSSGSKGKGRATKKPVLSVAVQPTSVELGSHGDGLSPLTVALENSDSGEELPPLIPCTPMASATFVPSQPSAEQPIASTSKVTTRRKPRASRK